MAEALHSGPLGFTHFSTIYSLSPLGKKTFFQQEISGLLTNWSLDQLRLEMQKEVSIIAANDSFQYHYLMNKQNIKNLLIDLGDVLYKIDIPTMLAALESLRPDGATPIDFTKAKQHEIFLQLEKGEIESTTFVQGLRETYNIAGDDPTILAAWGKILIGVIPGRKALISKLAQHFKLALLSNTNQPHHDIFGPEMEPIFAYFQRLFMSYQMHLAKPQAEIYHKVLEEMNWQAEETLFLDDSASNIKGAEAVGLQTYWVETPEKFEWIANELLELKASV